MGFGIIWRDNNDEGMRMELPENIDTIIFALADIGKAVEDSQNKLASGRESV